MVELCHQGLAICKLRIRRAGLNPTCSVVAWMWHKEAKGQGCRQENYFGGTSWGLGWLGKLLEPEDRWKEKGGIKKLEDCVGFKNEAKQM